MPEVRWVRMEKAYPFMRIGVRAVPGHNIVKRHSAGLESTTSLCVVYATDKTHAFGHGIAVVPGWAECIFLNKPTGGEDYD